MKQPTKKQCLGPLLKVAASAFKTAFIPLLIFELSYKIFLFFVIHPLVLLIIQLFLHINGTSLVFNDEVWRFALSPLGILALILLTVLVMALVYFEVSMIVLLLKQSLEGAKVKIRCALIQTFWAFKTLKHPSSLLLCLYAFTLLFIYSGVTSTLLPEFTLPLLITEVLSNPTGLDWVLLGMSVLLILMVFCLLIILPSMILDSVHYSSAARKSIQVIKDHQLGFMLIVLIAIALWVSLSLFPEMAFKAFFNSADIELSDIFVLRGFSQITPALIVLWLLFTFIQILPLPITLSLFTAYYLPLTEQTETKKNTSIKAVIRLSPFPAGIQKILLNVDQTIETAFRRTKALHLINKHYKLFIFMVLLVLIVTPFGSLYTGTTQNPVAIGHRGSAYAVENTLESIQYAIDAKADFAEIDVHLSKDNIPVVIHSSNLEWLSGQNLNVYDLTAEELQNITLNQSGKSGTIPTLEEVVGFCDGKIHLAIDYKIHKHENVDITERVMQVIQANKFQNDCIFLSVDYSIISQMQTSYPQYRSGYCVYSSIGIPTTESLLALNIDILFIEKRMVSRDLMRAGNDASIPIYVWTTNDASKMRAYLELGASGLISDYPDVAVKVVSSKSA